MKAGFINASGVFYFSIENNNISVVKSEGWNWNTKAKLKWFEGEECLDEDDMTFIKWHEYFQEQSIPMGNRDENYYSELLDLWKILNK